MSRRPRAAARSEDCSHWRDGPRPRRLGQHTTLHTIHRQSPYGGREDWAPSPADHRVPVCQQALIGLCLVYSLTSKEDTGLYAPFYGFTQTSSRGDIGMSDDIHVEMTRRRTTDLFIVYYLFSIVICYCHRFGSGPFGQKLFASDGSLLFICYLFVIYLLFICYLISV